MAGKGEAVGQAAPRGAYLSIAALIRERVGAGIYDGGVPSEADLVSELAVSRNTIRRALKVLAEEGLIVSRPGSGWRLARGDSGRPLLQRLVDVIAEDGLAVGDPYPSESNLCDRFASSRTAVRRALAQMEGKGLLDTVHGKGRMVRALPGSVGQP
ncbi:GntR family transcriptional regulator [Streptomyces sp. NPDC058740]|uniref:GntR family transcriptional regulator n=1 Tax=Streptomyces sp. NPDC058740 TaxID=3346619 RepID=UPI0036A9D3DB